VSWVGWRCQRCRHEFKKNQRFCPQCGYTVYDPIHDHERPDWVEPKPSTGVCLLCQEDVPSEELVDHIRVMHPAEYGDGPMLWPDGKRVVVDESELDEMLGGSDDR
jgi:hypothetical protein